MIICIIAMIDRKDGALPEPHMTPAIPVVSTDTILYGTSGWFREEKMLFEIAELFDCWYNFDMSYDNKSN